MTAPLTFDPVEFIADMHAIGVALAPYTMQDGARAFDIAGRPGVPCEILDVNTKWAAAARAHPDWMAAVHDALIARRGGL